MDCIIAKALITPTRLKPYLKNGVTFLAVETEVIGHFTILTTWLGDPGTKTYKKQAVPYECFLTGTEPSENSQRYWRVYGFDGRPSC